MGCGYVSLVGGCRLWVCVGGVGGVCGVGVVSGVCVCVGCGWGVCG